MSSLRVQNHEWTGWGARVNLFCTQDGYSVEWSQDHVVEGMDEVLWGEV